jgi:aminoglycoside 6'-N-acetyltransferase
VCGEGVICGERVLLRLVQDTDFELLVSWFSDPEFVRWWGGEPLSCDQVQRKYLGRRAGVTSYLVVAAAEPVGYAQACLTAVGEGGIDLVLVPRAQGRGLGPDAVRALVRHLLHVERWVRVTVDPAADNERAVRAWRHAGFVEVSRDGGVVVMQVTQDDLAR